MGITKKQRIMYDEVIECDKCGATLKMADALTKTWEELRRTGFDTTYKWYTFLINEGKPIERTVALCPKCQKAVVEEWWLRSQSELAGLTEAVKDVESMLTPEEIASIKEEITSDASANDPDDIPF